MRSNKSPLSSLSRTVGLELGTLMRLSDTGVVTFTAEGRRTLLPRFEQQGLDPLGCTSLAELRDCFKTLMRAERAQLGASQPPRELDLENRRFLKRMLQSSDTGPTKARARKSESPLSSAKVVDLAHWRQSRVKA